MEGEDGNPDQTLVPPSKSGRAIPGQRPIDFLDQAGKSPSAGMDPSEEGLYISKKRSKGNFVLVRVLSATCYSIIHYVAIEGQVQQMEVRYINNAYELELMKRTKKLCADGLYVELEPVDYKEYSKFKRPVRKYLKKILNIRRISGDRLQKLHN